jgi:predicted acetyltransferase
VSEPELVNPVPVDDAEAWMRALVTTLLGNPYEDDFPRRLSRWSRDWLPERTWAYRDHGRIIATLATEPRMLTIPGQGTATHDVEVDALTGVTVAATHRRRGLLTRMITESLQAAKDRGDPLSILIAAEWPIYGRYGYAAAVDNAAYTYYPRRPNGALPPAAPGSVRQVEPDELAQYARAIFETARRQRPGQIDRRDPWWDRRLSQDGYEPIGPQPNWILHEGPDGPDGLLAWKVTRDFELDGALGAIEVNEFVAATDAAYRDLWGYLSGIDVVGEIALGDRPVDEPIRWQLKDGRTLKNTGVGDFLWVRLLDVPAALSARGYTVPGRIVLDVVDHDHGGYGSGRVLLDVTGNRVECGPTTDAADLRLTQKVLASIYLGGHRLRALAHSGGVEELTPGALDRADVMFATPLAPWLQTGF